MADRPLRIAMVSLHTSPIDSPGSGDAGGMNVVEWHQAMALAELGHEVELLTRRGDPGLPDAIALGPGVTLRHLTAGPPARLAKSAIDQHIPEFTEALAELVDSGQARPYDLIHSQHWMSGAAALPLARAWGIPHLQSYHSVAATPGSALSDGEPPESPARVPGEAALARESDLVVAISAAEARTVIERCGADPDRVAIVPPGVDQDLFRPLAPNEAAAPTPPGTGPALPPEVDLTRHKRGFIVFAARLQPLKAPDLAIAGLAHVPEPIRPDLIVAGDDSPDFADYPAYLHALVDEFGLDDYVHLVGPQDRAGLAWLLRRAVLCLVPSHSETFGLVALEAAASGTPVLAAARGGLREAVVHGESGRLMDSRQPEDWGVAMTKLLSDRRGLAGMGVVARVHARRFSWAATASQLERLYRQVLLPTGRATALPDPAATTGSDSTPGSGPGSTHDSAATDAEPTPPGTSPSGDAERRPTSPADRPARRRQAQRYLFLHAHPDDETLGTGPIILALVRAGAEPIIVTATRGELGEVTPRVARTLGRAGLTTRRLSERTRAIAQLGAWDAGFLGTPPNRAPGQDPRVYSDSGMAWVTPTVAGPAPQSPATALCRAPLDEVVADVVACARHWRADSLVSYDAAGGYGHPDHVRCHQAGRRAARELGLPFWEIVTPQTGAGASTGTDSAEVTVYEAGPGLERLIAAHQAYSSQFTVTADHQGLVHVGGQAAPLLARAGLRLILPPSDGPDSSGDGPD